jgi:succinate dehydrogenase / fumarate reductase cytochrome b subunit
LNSLAFFFSSSVGRKWIVGLTGVALVGFVTGHMVGNLQIFLGQEAINKYAAALQSLGELLWLIRFGLLAVVVAHIWFTIQLTRENRRARPVKYAVRGFEKSTVASRTMIVSGLILLCFIIFHLLHFTAHKVDPTYATWLDGKGRHDVHRMMIAGFKNVWASGFYLLGVFLLCQHMSHGIVSCAQTLGVKTNNLASFWAKLAPVWAWGVFVGYAAIPVAVLAGYFDK